MNIPKSLVRSGRTLAAALCGVIVVSTQAAAREPDAQRTLDGELAASQHVVRVDNRFGPVTVVGVDRDFGWRWKLTCSGDKEEAEAYVKASDLEVGESDGTLQLRFVPPDERGGRHGATSRFLGWVFGGSGYHGVNVTSSLEVRVPRGVTVAIKNRFGSVKAADFRGPLEVDGQNASVDVSGVEKAVTASTSFASMHVARTGPAQLRNQNGELQVSAIAGDLHAASSFAWMRVQDVKGRADLKNQNGEIDVLRVTGDLAATSSFGKITARDITGGADLRDQNGSVEARHVGGDVTAISSFARMLIEDVGAGASLKCQNGEIDALHIAGALVASNSFAPLRVDVVGGDVVLESQNGEVTARGVTGIVRAKTSFARMQLDGEGKRFEARNQNGEVLITARSPAVEQISATTSFAPIAVSLPHECRPLIRANTSFGKVRSDFPVMLDSTSTAAATSGDATQPKITLRGQNGDIRVQQL